MKTLFSDTVIAKIRKIPAWIWVCLLLISFYFADAYYLLITGEYYSAYLAELYAELGYSINTTTMGVMATVLEAGIFTLIFEVLIGIIYNIAVGRFRCQINRSDFKFRSRLIVIIANTIIGILSIGYFFTQKIDGTYTGTITLFGNVVNALVAENPYADIQRSILPFIVMSLSIAWFYEDFRTRYVPKRNQGKLFSYIARLYIGIYLILAICDFFYNFMILKTTHSTVEIIAYSTNLGVKALMAVAAYFNAKRLNKISEEPEDNDIFIAKEDHTKKNIFDDFGF